MEKIEDLYDDKKLREYSNNIRKFIYNILNDLRIEKEMLDFLKFFL